MNTAAQSLPDVYSADEIARAAGVHPRDVRALAELGAIHPLAPGHYYAAADAVAAVRTLRGAPAPVERPLFRPSMGLRRQPGMPIAASGTFHAAMVGMIVFLASFGVTHSQVRVADDLKNLHMVFLIAPGPGGGGGGGGLKAPKPPAPAEHKGPEKMRSPIVVTHHPPPPRVVPAAREVPPPRIEPPPVIVRQPDPPPVVAAPPIPPVVAPVVPAAPDPRDRAGIPWHPATDSDETHGPGTGGGAGSGQGTGVGPGTGAGIGPGSGGGTGGGPYRPGTGITAPSILREVTPDYTDEGRRRGIEGDVVLEIVVRADGSVGSVKTLRGLGAGLDQRAADAVRQWRFNPARRYGTPVDVIVEVAVEFKLR